MKALIHDDLDETLTLLFVLFLIWNALDVTLTVFAVSSGIAHEKNAILNTLPLPYAMLLKMSLALLIGTWWLAKNKLGRLVAGGILLYLVCIWNILVIQGVV